MAEELKPYQLTEIYRQAKHSRINSWLFSLLALGAGVSGLGCWFSDMPFKDQTALGLLGTSLFLADRASNATKDAEKYARRKTAVEQASEDAILSNLVRSVQPGLPSIKLPEVLPEMQLYDWTNAPDEGVGFIIAGNSGAGKSSVATWLAGLLTQIEPAQCLVLDPHYNDIWQQQGLTSIGKIEEIESAIQSLLTELDERCDRKGKGESLGEPLLVIADEIGACLERFQNPKWIQSALKRLGSEGRKFGMTLVAINQSQNVEDLGISGSLRNNYVLILVGAAARKQARQLGKEYEDYLKGTAYPCMVSGAAENSIAIHPTHGGYSQFKKKGNPPQNLIPIRQLPLTFNLDGLGDVSDRAPSPKPANPDVDLLERCLELPVEDPEPTFPPHLALILECAKDRGGRISARDAMRYPGLANKHSAEQVKAYFAQLEQLGLGIVITDPSYGGRTFFELPKATTEASNEHWTDQLEEWLQQNPEPTDAELRAKIETLTGLPVSETALSELKGFLF